MNGWRERARKFLKPEGFQAWRWRALLVWIVFFSVVVAWDLKYQRDHFTDTQDRFCVITASFITSNIALTKVLADAIEIQTAARRQQNAALETLQVILGIGPEADYTTRAYLQSVQDANEEINVAAQRVSAASARAVSVWRKLRKGLECG